MSVNYRWAILYDFLFSLQQSASVLIFFFQKNCCSFYVKFIYYFRKLLLNLKSCKVTLNGFYSTIQHLSPLVPTLNMFWKKSGICANERFSKSNARCRLGFKISNYKIKFWKWCKICIMRWKNGSVSACNVTVWKWKGSYYRLPGDRRDWATSRC